MPPVSNHSAKRYGRPVVVEESLDWCRKSWRILWQYDVHGYKLQNANMPHVKIHSYNGKIEPLTWDPSTFSHKAAIWARKMLCRSDGIMSLCFLCGKIASFNPIASSSRMYKSSFSHLHLDMDFLPMGFISSEGLASSMKLSQILLSSFRYPLSRNTSASRLDTSLEMVTNSV